MHSKKLLIASSSRNEAITKWVLNNKTLTLEIDLILIEDLLNKYCINDKLDDDTTLIRWYENNALKFSNSTHFLLNRITHINESLFENFQCNDKEYAKREFEAYLGFALNSFVSPQQIAINGTCEKFYSLPQQWNAVNRYLNFDIPKYYWGSKDFKPFRNEKDIIYSNIYNFLNWHPRYSLKNSGFCFKKPQGSPVFILSIGKSYLITPTNHILSKTKLILLERYLKKIRTLFNFFIFELLVFVNENSITFGCVNPEIIHSPKNPSFNSFLLENLLKEYHLCIN